VVGVPRSIRVRRFFVDSSAHLALLDRRDRYHGEAVAILGRLADLGHRPYTTNVVIIESHALILSTLGDLQASRFLRDVDGSSMVVVRTRASDEQRAKDILFRYTDKDFSFADALGFVVMGRVDIPWSLTFDQDFGQYGLATLTLDQL